MWIGCLLFPMCYILIYSLVIYSTEMVWYKDSVGNSIEENSSIFWLTKFLFIAMRVVKLSSNKVLQLLIGSAGYHRPVVKQLHVGVCVLYLDSCAIYFVRNNELFFSNDSRVNCTVAVKSEIYCFRPLFFCFVR